MNTATTTAPLDRQTTPVTLDEAPAQGNTAAVVAVVHALEAEAFELFGPAWVAARSDSQACQTCGEPFAAPECDDCFEARWTPDETTPLANLAGTPRR